MIAGLKPYPEYKDSGVEWLGDVPEHWEVKRLQNVAEMRVSNVDKHTKDDEQPIRLCNYVDVYKNDRIWDRMTFMRATATLDETERFRLQEGDVLITKDSEAWDDIGVPAIVEESADDLVCGYHLAQLRPFHDYLNPQFLFRAIQSTAISYQFHVEANGVTRYGLSHSAIKSILLPLPSIPEQTAIVRFLDYADNRIRRSIKAKQKLITLLEEEKQAIIHHAVTRGLDPDVPLKPSGVEWLGDVPEHWEIRRTKVLFCLRTEKSGIAHGRELLSIYTHIGVRPRKELEEKGNKASTTDDYWVVKRGDIIVNKLLAWMGAIGVSNYEGVTSPAYDILMPNVEAFPQYYHHIFRTKLYLRQFKQRSRGIMDVRLRLYFDQFGQIPLPVPPIDEQVSIVNFLDETAGNISNAIFNAKKEITLLREYRTRLIADVVTGKLDVREAAANLPEVDEYDGFDISDEPDRLVDSDDGMLGDDQTDTIEGE
jgi:type I restriction enzyme S subunit